MKKVKKISGFNLPIGLPLTHFIVLYFLWDKFQAEWFRTVLVIWAIFYIIVIIIAFITTEPIDIFKDK